MSVLPGSDSVLIVVATAMRRGAEIEAHAVANGLRDRGLAVSLVALEPGSGGAADEHVEVLGSSPLGPTALRKLQRRSRAHSAVIAWGSKALPACAIAVERHTPWLYRSIGHPSAWVRGPLHQSLTRLQYQRASGVVALWQGAGSEIHTLYRVGNTRIDVIANTRDSNYYRPASVDERQRARLSFGLPQDGTVAVALGALSREKGLDLAINAALALPDCHLLVVGDGPLREHLWTLVRGLDGAGERIRFVGQLDDPRPALAAADVLVLSSVTEGMPGVVIEALLMGVAVAAVPVGAVPEMLFGYRSAYVTSGRTPTELAVAIREAAGTGDGTRDEARRLAAATFDVSRIAERWETVISRHARGVGR